MTIIQKINDFFKKKARLFPLIDTKVLRIEKFNPFIVISFLLIFSSFFFISSTLIENKNTYEELLQDGRYKLKELSVKYREQTQKLNEYEKLIPMLYNSR